MFSIKKQPYNPLKSFDDSSLPAGLPISKERSLEIEEKIMPTFLEEFEKFKKTNSAFSKKK